VIRRGFSFQECYEKDCGIHAQQHKYHSMFPCLAHEINTYILNISGITNIFYLATSSDKFVHYWSSLGRCQARDFFLLFSRLQKSSVINLDTIKLGVIAPHKCASLLGRFFYLSVKEHIFFRRVKRRLGGIDKSRDWDCAGKINCKLLWQTRKGRKQRSVRY